MMNEKMINKNAKNKSKVIVLDPKISLKVPKSKIVNPSAPIEKTSEQKEKKKIKRMFILGEIGEKVSTLLLLFFFISLFIHPVLAGILFFLWIISAIISAIFGTILELRTKWAFYSRLPEMKKIIDRMGKGQMSKKQNRSKKLR